MTTVRVHDVTCIVCRKEYPVAEAKDGWFFMQGFYEPGVLVVACPSCKPVYAVGIDNALAMGGEPPLSSSIACAWAFHLGQYEASAIAEGWDGKGPHRRDVGDWRARTFTRPETLGTHGWGRWSQVRREAQTQLVTSLVASEGLEVGQLLELDPDTVGFAHVRASRGERPVLGAARTRADMGGTVEVVIHGQFAGNTVGGWPPLGPPNSVHVLDLGITLCGQNLAVAPLPPDHRWVRPEDGRTQATCIACRAGLRDRIKYSSTMY